MFIEEGALTDRRIFQLLPMRRRRQQNGEEPLQILHKSLKQDNSKIDILTRSEAKIELLRKSYSLSAVQATPSDFVFIQTLWVPSQ